MTDSNSPPVENDYDTGVSNGDVDWLFRGKSKKLTKKMNNPTDKKERRDSKHDIKPDDKKELSDQLAKTNQDEKIKQDHSTKQDEKAKYDDKTTHDEKTVQNTVQNSDTDKAKKLTQEKKEEALPEKTSHQHQEAEKERISKLEKFRLGRSRSSSGSSFSELTPPQPSPQRRRRSSLGFSSVLAEQSESPGVSRSNSGSGKSRSLFSSLSSKFKSSLAATTNTGGCSSPSSPASVSPVVSSTQPKAAHSKLNPNLIGTASSSPGSERQDLPSFINKPLAGIPMSMKRRSSIGSNAESSSRESSVDKDFGKYFKKILPSSTPQSSHLCPADEDRVVLNRNPHRTSVPLKDLDGVKLRRVTFAIDLLPHDPQQQIPSRRPKKGNVLIPEDIMAPSPRLSQGISLSSDKNGSVAAQTEHKYSDKEIALAVDSQKRALLEAEKHAHEAHLSARRIAHEVSQYKCKNTVPGKEEEIQEELNKEGTVLDHNVENIAIDKPLHLHENHFEDPTEEVDTSVDELTLEAIYTRCCHLREILPIPATLKQLKNKSKPLEVLKLLNPRPTLIDVLSFSDFIALVPINTIIFDNVTMTTEMLKHLLSSLLHNKSLEKLSLRNVAIDDLGWKYLCKFLSRNLSVKKLDISQQKIKSDTPKNCVRSAMNWNLLIQSIVIRGGIEELVINGCKLPDETFLDLIKNAVTLSTCRLGVASCELNIYKTQVITDWINDPSSKCMGVDVAFNDLSQGQLAIFTEAFKKGNDKLAFFSLNSTNINNVDEAAEFIRSLTQVSTLRFLDFSSLPELFPGIVSKLAKYLPQFPSLRRIHFDLNELSGHTISVIADILPKLPLLVHVSFLGNKDITHSAAASLYTAVKVSKTIFTLDIDYDLIPDKLSQKIVFYLMRNMENSMKPALGDIQLTSSVSNNDDQEELIFDGSLLMETAEKLLVEEDAQSGKEMENMKIQKIITDATIERARIVREQIHRSIDELFEKRNKGKLSFDGKEILLRFCLLDSSLEKVVHMYEEKAKSFGILTAQSRTPSIQDLHDVQKGPETPEPTVDSPVKTQGRRDHGLPSLQIQPPVPPLADHDNLHESSTELITAGPILSPRNTSAFDKQGMGNYFGMEQTFQPHQVVTESSSDGTDVPIDNLTGRPVLMRSISQTSVHAKEQEKEEGEFHRWGFFISLRNNDDIKNKLPTTSSPKEKQLPVLNVLPSGSELREAVIAAKGIESVTELIDKINNDRVSIEKIYNLQDSKTESSEKTRKIESPQEKKESDTESIDSFEIAGDKDDNQNVNAVVDEVYDKLLNDAQRVRSNK